MSKRSVAGNIQLSKFDDLFGNSEENTTKKESDIMDIPLSELHEFANHPFKIRSDEELEEMLASVKQHGVLVPGIVRVRPAGGYEIIAGHTRKRVCELAGIESMPMVIRNLNDDEACIVMVDSNIQREDILPSEKAKAYKMKHDAMKNQGLPGNSLKLIGEENGENYKAVQRFIWLSRLNDDLLEMVDCKKLGFSQGVSISALQPEEQELLYRILVELGIKLSLVQASTIKQLSVDGKLTEEMLVRYLNEIKDVAVPRKVTIKNDTLDTFFTKEYSEAEIMDIIFGLLEEWKRREQS